MPGIEAGNGEVDGRECEARVAHGGNTKHYPSWLLASTHDVPQDNTVPVTDDEVIIPSQTFNFLKGLNDD